jgi:drug/metabolite transporter (DMT)-like permease
LKFPRRFRAFVFSELDSPGGISKLGDRMTSSNSPGENSRPSHQSPHKASAILELVFAASLWGFGFIAAIWALEAMSPLAVTGWRFFLASLFGGGVVLFTPSLRRELAWATFRLAAPSGFFLSLTLVLQTWGLRYTTATKSGFITCLYVLIVPLLERVFLRRKLHRLHYVFVSVALIGVALIGDIHLFFDSSSRSGALNFGDFLTLLCAIAASLHILSFGFIATRIGSSFVFNFYQSVWAGAIPLALSFFIEPGLKTSLLGRPLMGLGALVFGSTLIAFALQVRAQKVLSPSIASLLFLLESPFATLYAIYLLNESLRTEQWAGAGLILVAAAAASFAALELARD